MKKVHVEVKKLNQSISEFGSSDLSHSIAYGKELPINPTNNEKKEWVEFISNELEKNFDEETIKNIRMGCHCTENGKLDESKTFIKRVFSESSNFEEFVSNMNKNGAGWFIDNEDLFTQFHSCSCSMLDGVDVLPTKTWCYCTVGFNKSIFEDVFECEVDIELVESIKMGDDRCLMRIIPSNNPFIKE